MTIRMQIAVAMCCAHVLVGCGSEGSDQPPDVTLGETTIVVVVNPPINDANDAEVAAPGDTRQGVTVSSDDGVSMTTGESGVAVLADVTPGRRTITLTAGSDTGEVSVRVSDGDLREVAVAFDAAGAAVMASEVYELSGEVIAVDSQMSIDEVNDALSQSDTIVLFTDGVYTGDLQFSGSNLTLFGVGPTGGRVTIDGNVTVDGSNNRFRGALVTGDLDVPGSEAWVSFGRVDGVFELSGSAGSLVENTYCGTASVTGSGATVLGNAGLPPIDSSAGGC